MYVGNNVVRTQIYLPESLHRALGRAARQRGVSMAELIRDALPPSRRSHSTAVVLTLVGYAVPDDDRERLRRTNNFGLAYAR
jgi:hypothetical protein